MAENLSDIYGCGRQDCRDLHSWGPALRSVYIIHYIIKGKGTLIVDKKNYLLESGQSFLIYPYTRVQYFPDPDDPWEYAWVDFLDSEFQSQIPQLRFAADRVVFDRIEPEDILPFFTILLRQNPNNRTFDATGHALLNFYVDRFSTYANAPVENRLSDAVAIIRANFYLPDFTMQSVCDQLGISRVTLYRLFKEKLDTSPNDYLTDFRLAQAKKMLKKQWSVKDTALSCGYWDPLYFSKIFKSRTGVSPKAFKTSQAADA